MPPPNPRNSSQSNQPRIAINPVKKPPAKKTNTPTITLPATPTITLPTTPTPTPTPTVRTPPIRSVRTPPTPKINLSTSTEPKLTLPTYSTGFTSNQRNQPQTTANNNYSQEDNFLKKYPQILLVIPLILIIMSKK